MLLPLYVHAKNLTMAVNKQLQNMVFLQTKVTYNHFIVQCNSSFPSALFRFSVLDEIYHGFAVFGDFLRGFPVINSSLRPPHNINLPISIFHSMNVAIDFCYFMKRAVT